MSGLPSVQFSRAHHLAFLLGLTCIDEHRGEVSRERADEAIGLVDDIVREWLFSTNHRIS